MAIFLNQSLNAIPVYMANQDGSLSATASAANATTGTGLIGSGMLGRYASAAPTYTDGQFGILQLDTNGFLLAAAKTQGSALTDGLTNTPVTIANKSGNGIAALSYGVVYNGSTWDRERGDASGIYNSGPTFYADTTTALGASATFVGTTRQTGGTAGGLGSRFNYFYVELLADQTGSVQIQRSNDGFSTNNTVATANIVANTMLIMKVQVAAAAYRVKVINGSTAQTTLNLISALTVV